LPDKTTPLDERMRLFHKGQLTWPEPKLGKFCDACRFYYVDNAAGDKGRCDLYQLHMKKKGNLFGGRDARACPKFEAGRFGG